jgi:hypothetical protein
LQKKKSRLAQLSDMRVRDFTLRSTGERRTGVIVREMLPLHPDMVHLGFDSLYAVDGLTRGNWSRRCRN